MVLPRSESAESRSPRSAPRPRTAKRARRGLQRVRSIFFSFRGTASATADYRGGRSLKKRCPEQVRQSPVQSRRCFPWWSSRGCCKLLLRPQRIPNEVPLIHWFYYPKSRKAPHSGSPGGRGLPLHLGRVEQAHPPLGAYGSHPYGQSSMTADLLKGLYETPSCHASQDGLSIRRRPYMTKDLRRRSGK